MPTDLETRAPRTSSIAPLAVAPTPRLAALALGVGVAGDLAVRAGRVGLGVALLVAVASAALLASERCSNRHGRALLLLAPVFGLCLAVRTSPWLVPVDLLAAIGLLAVGASFARRGSLADVPPRAVVERAAHGALHLAYAPALVPRPDKERSRQALPALRGLLLAVPVVLVLGALLRSADVVFDALLDVDLGLGDSVEHVTVVALVGWFALGLLRTASADDPETIAPLGWRIGRPEATVVLVAVAALYAAFVTSSIVTALGGADHVLETAGLTRAEYARSGFFQLLWVAGLTIVGVLVLAGAVDPGDRRTRRLATLVVALALPIVAVAVVRLDLYRYAYGWTMLRLVCTVVAVWLGGVLALLTVVVLRNDRRWFVPAALGLGLALLLAVNVANPEALVARHNLTRDATVAVDPAYLAELSDDAVPTIVDLLPDDDAVALVGCPEPDGGSWAAWNLGANRAEAARQRVCRG